MAFSRSTAGAAVTGAGGPPWALALQAREPPHDHVGEVARHVLAQDVFLVTLGEEQPLVEAVAARGGDLLRGEELPAPGRDHEADRIGDLVLIRLIRAGHRQHAPRDTVPNDADHGGGLVLLARQVRAVREQRAAQALHEFALPVGRLQVRSLHRVGQRHATLEVKAAGARERRRHDEQRPDDRRPRALRPHPALRAPARGSASRAHQTTTLTSFPGTTITRLTGLSATNLRTLSSASAAACTAASSEFTGTLMCPRSLPFTCTTMVCMSCASAAASGSGQGSSISALVCPSASHSA